MPAAGPATSVVPVSMAAYDALPLGKDMGFPCTVIAFKLLERHQQKHGFSEAHK